MDIEQKIKAGLVIVAMLILAVVAALEPVDGRRVPAGVHERSGPTK